MSYLVTLITKAIDTTSNSYQPLWLRCWKGDIFSFFTKTLDSSSYIWAIPKYTELLFCAGFVRRYFSRSFYPINMEF